MTENQNQNQDQGVQAAGAVVAEAKDAFRRARQEGRAAADEAWEPAIAAVEQRLEVVRDLLAEPDLAPEAGEALNRQLAVLAETLGRCRAARLTSYTQADAAAMASLRGLIAMAPTAPPPAGLPAQIVERIAAAARGRPVAVPPEGRP